MLGMILPCCPGCREGGFVPMAQGCFQALQGELALLHKGAPGIKGLSLCLVAQAGCMQANSHVPGVGLLHQSVHTLQYLATPDTAE